MSVLTSAIGTWPGRALLGAIVAMVVGVPLVISRVTAAPAPAEYRTTAVTRGAVTQTVSVSGSVNAAGTVRLNFKSAGRLAEVLVKVGDQVTPGQALARLDTADLAVAVAQANATLASAEAKYEQTAAGASPEDIAIARLSVDNAQRSLEQARKTTENDVESSRLSTETAQRSLEQTQRTIANDLANAQAALTRAASTFSSSRAGYASLTGAVTSETTAYDSEIERARAQLTTAQDRLAPKVASADSKAAQSAVYSAQLSLTNASGYVQSGVRPALAEYAVALTDLQRAIGSFDAAIAAGQDTSAAAAAYQAAQLAYTTAATKLSGSLDAPTGQLAAAQASVASAQSSLNTTATRTDTSFDDVRADLAALQVTLTGDQQRATLTKSRIAQAGSTLASLTDAVGGAYLSALNAVSTARAKNDASLASAQNTVAKAEQDLSSAQERARTSIVTSENALESTRATLAKASTGAKSYDIASAYAGVLAAQASLEKTQNDLNGALLRAPAGGTVTAIGGQVGEFVAGGGTSNPFITIANLTSLALHGTVGEADVAKLRPGQVATVAVDAVGTGTRMTGKVTVIDPAATIQQGVPVYGVDVTLDVPNAQVRPGMSGTASVIIASRTNVLTVPNLAVRTTAGRRGVQVLRDGQPVDSEVTLGISNETVTEVASGLQEGDLVVLPQPRATTPAQQNQPRIGGGGVPVVPGR
ncbi:MAG: HlyD family efflux transporter periplasmic adaptor subunit [Chloroflexota bacterium]|nr:HlyD family efflux transporter periplasmic adaptor subunit [Chloroflexota bacterium]